MNNPTTPEPVCKFEQGCHRVAACDPGCALPAGLVAVPPTTADRELIADAIRNAACPGNCGTTEEQCAKERIQPFAWHHGRLAVVEGTPEQFADAVLGVWPAGSEDTTATRAAVERVLALHQPDANGECQHCHRSSPCPTVQALEGAEDERLRRLAAETQPSEAPWATDGSRIGRVLIWSWARVGDTDFGQGYRTAQEDVRAILTRPLLGAEERPEPEPDAPRREPHPTEADLRHALAVAATFHGQATAAPVHVGGRANAEDCPACINPPYPFICPGPDGAAS